RTDRHLYRRVQRERAGRAERVLRLCAGQEDARQAARTQRALGAADPVETRKRGAAGEQAAGRHDRRTRYPEEALTELARHDQAERDRKRPTDAAARTPAGAG